MRLCPRAFDDAVTGLWAVDPGATRADLSVDYA